VLLGGCADCGVFDRRWFVDEFHVTEAAGGPTSHVSTAYLAQQLVLASPWRPASRSAAALVQYLTSLGQGSGRGMGCWHSTLPHIVAGGSMQRDPCRLLAAAGPVHTC